MKTHAAVLHGVHQDWKIEEIDLDPPKAGEVLVKWKAAGMCHSDEHLVTGDGVIEQPDLPSMFPIIGGHEGAGIVLEVGPNVKSVQPGDHVSASFIPSCGTCRYCSTGRQSLCDLGATLFSPGQITDGTSRHWLNGQELGFMVKLGTFAEHSVVAEASVIKVDDDYPLDVVALVSCGVATGFGSATKRAEVRPGDVVVVSGCGGIGMNAIQGAKLSGARAIIAVDPLEFKREKAMEFGATHTVSSLDEAIPLVTEISWGQMADAVILTMGVVHGEHLGPAMQLTGKGATCVVTGIAPVAETSAAVNLFELAMWQKQIRGTIFGGLNPRADIPNLLKMYRAGQLKLDELISKRYTLDQINEGYQDQRDGKTIRGVIMMD